MASAAVGVPFNEERRNQYPDCKDVVEDSPVNTPTRSFSDSDDVNREEEENYQNQEEHADGLSGVPRHPPLEIINTHMAGTTMSESENSKKDSGEAKVMLVNGDTEKVTSTGEGSGEIENSRIPQTERRESGLGHFAIVCGSTYKYLPSYFSYMII
jgi:hypothetical protein